MSWQRVNQCLNKHLVPYIPECLTGWVEELLKEYQERIALSQGHRELSTESALVEDETGVLRVVDNQDSCFPVMELMVCDLFLKGFLF